MYRGISDFKKVHQPRTNIVNDEKGDLVTDFHNILNRWGNHFSQLLNIHGIMMLGRLKYVEPLVTELSAYAVEIANEKLRAWC